MSDQQATLVLRLAGPMQAWGGESEFNRRDTGALPTKSGIVGLLAAARGLRREDPIEDLVALSLGVRIDQPGSVLRDYHTVSDYRGVPMLSAQVDAKGRQRPTTPKKFTGVTQRFYLQDAVFVAAVRGEREFIASLEHAVRHPAFPLALGRRSCVPTQPLVIGPADDDGVGVWDESIATVLGTIPWQAPERAQHRFLRGSPGRTPRLPATVDATEASGGSVAQVHDVPASFDPKRRSFSSRTVRHIWVEPPFAAGVVGTPGEPTAFNSFELLGVD